jgi:hypothetical protein
MEVGRRRLEGVVLLSGFLLIVCKLVNRIFLLHFGRITSVKAVFRGIVTLEAKISPKTTRTVQGKYRISTGRVQNSATYTLPRVWILYTSCRVTRLLVVRNTITPEE